MYVCMYIRMCVCMKSTYIYIYMCVFMWRFGPFHSLHSFVFWFFFFLFSIPNTLVVCSFKVSVSVWRGFGFGFGFGTVKMITMMQMFSSSSLAPKFYRDNSNKSSNGSRCSSNGYCYHSYYKCGVPQIHSMSSINSTKRRQIRLITQHFDVDRNLLLLLLQVLDRLKLLIIFIQFPFHFLTTFLSCFS